MHLQYLKMTPGCMFSYLYRLLVRRNCMKNQIKDSFKIKGK